MKMGPIVTIDGPSGSGKSTIARLLADRLGFRFIDTGAMYRGIGWLAKEQGVPFRECEELDMLLKEARLFLVEKKGETTLFVNDCDVTDRIRTPEMGMVASNISAIGSVRQWLSALQRELGEEGNAVLEGRDMGTVVFPDGDVKFFLTASLEERGRRRTAQLIEKGETADLQTVIDEMSLRDRNDTNRALAPLKKADDAIEIDTTSMTVQEVVERLVQEVQAGTKIVPE
jgi:cytidylate kinase